MADPRPLIVVLTDSSGLASRVSDAAARSGASCYRLPADHYRHAFARILMAAGPGARPAGAVIDMQAAIPAPSQLAEQLSRGGVPALLVVPAVRENVVRRATIGGTILGVLTHRDGLAALLTDRIGRMVRASSEVR